MGYYPDYQSWVCCMEYVFYLVLCQAEQIFFVVTSLHVSDVMLLLWQLQFFQENAEYIENGFIQEFHTTESAEI